MFHEPSCDKLVPAARNNAHLVRGTSEIGVKRNTCRSFALVLWMTEFGRMPKITRLGSGSNPGRDHWLQVFSVALASRGIRSKPVIGASDPIGGQVLQRPILPSEIAATICQLLAFISYWIFRLIPNTLGSIADRNPMLRAVPVQPLNFSEYEDRRMKKQFFPYVGR